MSPLSDHCGESQWPQNANLNNDVRVPIDIPAQNHTPLPIMYHPNQTLRLLRLSPHLLQDWLLNILPWGPVPWTPPNIALPNVPQSLGRPYSLPYDNFRMRFEHAVPWCIPRSFIMMTARIMSRTFRTPRSPFLLHLDSSSLVLLDARAMFITAFVVSICLECL